VARGGKRGRDDNRRIGKKKKDKKSRFLEPQEKAREKKGSPKSERNPGEEKGLREPIQIVICGEAGRGRGRSGAEGDFHGEGRKSIAGGNIKTNRGGGREGPKIL